jgi:hypothetical protein
MPSSRASAAISSCLPWNVKWPSAISSAKCFFYLVFVDHGSDREPDHTGIMLCGPAPHRMHKACQPTFRCLQNLARRRLRTGVVNQC